MLKEVMMFVGAYDLAGWTEEEYIVHKNGKVYVLGRYNQDWDIQDEADYNEYGDLESEMYDAEYIPVSYEELVEVEDNMGSDGCKEDWLKEVFEIEE